ncbi:MAG: AI-2E family transporter [Microcystaceae cyanobacterium]
MPTRIKASPIFYLLLGTASFVIVVAGLQAASSILNAFFLSLLIVINVTPLLQWLIRKGVPPKVALLLTILGVIVTGIAFLSFLGISIGQLLHTLPSYEGRIQQLKESALAFLASKGINTDAILTNETLQPQSLLKGAILFLQRLAEALGSSLLLLFIVAFMLIESTIFPNKLQKVFNPDAVIISKLTAFTHDIRTYMGITAWTGALSAFGDFLVLVFLGVDLAPLWGIMFFLLSFIPGIGFLLAVVPPMILALLEHDVSRAFWVFVGCSVIDNIVDKGIKPRFMQEGLDISILMIILSLVFWNWVLGPIGAILSVPLTMMVKKVILESYEETQFLAQLMSSRTEEGDRPVEAMGED